MPSVQPILDRAGKQHGWWAMVNGRRVSSQSKEVLLDLLAGKPVADGSYLFANKEA